MMTMAVRPPSSTMVMTTNNDNDDNNMLDQNNVDIVAPPLSPPPQLLQPLLDNDNDLARIESLGRKALRLLVSLGKVSIEEALLAVNLTKND